MVGNDVEEDLVIRDLGVKAYLVTDTMENKKELPIRTDYMGSLKDLVDFIRLFRRSRKDRERTYGNSSAEIFSRSGKRGKYIEGGGSAAYHPAHAEPADLTA